MFHWQIPLKSTSNRLNFQKSLEIHFESLPKRSQIQVQQAAHKASHTKKPSYSNVKPRKTLRRELQSFDLLQAIMCTYFKIVTSLQSLLLDHHNSKIMTKWAINFLCFSCTRLVFFNSHALWIRAMHYHVLMQFLKDLCCGNAFAKDFWSNSKQDLVIKSGEMAPLCPKCIREFGHHEHLAKISWASKFDFTAVARGELLGNNVPWCSFPLIFVFFFSSSYVGC